jgi:hypothetical protein
MKFSIDIYHREKQVPFKIQLFSAGVLQICLSEGDIFKLLFMFCLPLIEKLMKYKVTVNSCIVTNLYVGFKINIV